MKTSKTYTAALSVIVPTWNEEKNIRPLVEQIDGALKAAGMQYEVIFVDDHSTDKTRSVVRELAKDYPLTLKKKQGRKGKAFSLLEGFAYAKYPLIAMIDADLQYPPSALPDMVSRVEKGADIVVAERVSQETSFFRKAASKVFRFFFAKVLFHLPHDAQSGLKVFRKGIVEHLSLRPGAWSFDLEFLVKAHNAGYKIASLPVPFSRRAYGASKIHFLASALELAFAALHLKMKGPYVVPFLPTTAKRRGEGFYHNGHAFVHHARLKSHETALYLFTSWQKVLLWIIALELLIGFLLDWHGMLLVVLAIITFIYIFDLFFNLFIIYRSFSNTPEVTLSERKILGMTRVWPTYTIMCPLYKEWNVVPQFVSAMQSLDYPKDKLQVMFLLEKDDTETIDRLKRQDLPGHFSIVVVPPGSPKTKPKALNYGLRSATGEHIVVYDAEDIPDPLQLKKAVLVFEKLGTSVRCVQAKLNFYNPSQNILTKLFTAEYSLWFNLVLTGLQSIHAPLPLGGTSNHFKKQDLIELGGWDSFNMTEDADLGMRLAKRGYKTIVMNSYTMEEANSNLKNWFTQRSRWIKGYAQTYIVHMRNPFAFVREWRKPHSISFQVIIGGKVLSMIINPIMWVTTISYFVFRDSVGPTIESLFPPLIFYPAVVSLVCGNFLYTYYYVLGIAKRKEWDLIPFSLFAPFYWLIMSAAAMYGIVELVVRPHYWHKTKHGLHLRETEEIHTDETMLKKKRFAFLPAWGR